MAKIYKGWELMKAIADGKIKKNQKIRIIFKDNSGENYIFDGIDIIDSTYKNIFDIYGTRMVLKVNFELIEKENEIDIKKIPELLIEQLKDKGFTNADIYMLAQQQNNLLQTVKQLNKRLEKLEEKIK